MKPHHLAIVVGALACSYAAAVTAGVYKWVDKDGRTIYGDQPPPEKTAQSKEINTSGLPLALQERLKRLDKTFAIRRITGNLDTAWVCLQVPSGEPYGYEPPFVSELNASDLGTIAPASDVQDNTEYDSDGNRIRPASDRCPQRSTGVPDAHWVIYLIHFDPKAVAVYRGAP